MHAVVLEDADEGHRRCLRSSPWMLTKGAAALPLHETHPDSLPVRRFASAAKKEMDPQEDGKIAEHSSHLGRGKPQRRRER